MTIRLDSVYGWSVLSPRPPHASEVRSPLLNDDEMGDEEERLVRVTDLDTGFVRDVPMGMCGRVEL